jgi:hypothetical protein
MNNSIISITKYLKVKGIVNRLERAFLTTIEAATYAVSMTLQVVVLLLSLHIEISAACV